MLAGFLASTCESIGDYHAVARLAAMPPPSKRTINVGIGVEGLGCVLEGVFSTGNGTTSYSENVAVIGVTKVASRHVIQAYPHPRPGPYP